ncbi:D-aminoacylase [Actinobacteria bacterium YIM 96077]|uniref:D-aminoacylase n=1 Tax=Phytoactinopolyspora halophila TaxID=1981511 RepID=A0A329QG51_9ACTN|nr:D-aminoacylase [Phytoactinopolyspora halophila]AYY13632.1 D-aminoacylase [Actinobacteria bacterium YIM 96077]RAW11196.1 D-aminoacylase [Phytoactinopolyspora halophila]
MSEFEIVIRGGAVLDGTGSEPVVADIGISDGVIQAVSGPRAADGTNPPSRAERLTGHRVIDASDRVVAPGFIDLHSHADFTLEGWPAATTELHQGVTTLLTGNCGFSPFPVGDVEEAKTASAFLAPELSWSWRDHDGFAAALDKARPAINVAAQTGHSSLRLAAMGGAEREASPDDLARMSALLAEAAGSGAHGFSTGLIYAPGTYSNEEEVRQLVGVAADAGLLYSTHIRNEAEHLHEAIAEAIRAAEATGARLQISHLKAAGPRNHGAVTGALRLIDDAAARGVDVAADVYPYTASSTTLTTRLPAWALDGGPPELLRRLRHSGERERIAAELRHEADQTLGPENVVIADLGDGRYRDAVGSSLADVARREGTDPAEVTLRILEEHDAAVAVVMHGMSDDDVETVLRHPRVAVASDGWVMRPEGAGKPHPRNFGTFPRVLARYVRERGVLSLPEAVRKMTSLPASRLGLDGRGIIRPGAAADVVVFDPDTVTDRSTFADPWQLSTGVSTVLVNGQIALEGDPTGSRAGRVLFR